MTSGRRDADASREDMPLSLQGQPPGDYEGLSPDEATGSADSSREDELLSRLLEQVFEEQAARFAAGYDMAAGLDRYRAWLTGPVAAAGKAAEDAVLDGVPPEAPRPTEVTETITASALFSDVWPVPSVWDGDRVVTEIYYAEYESLVRLAALLVRDVPTAEEVVQDAFEAMHTAWRRLRDPEKALSYLRQAVVNRSRSVLRHRTVTDKNAPKPAPDEPSAEHEALALIERTVVVAALRTLPARQREAIVLRYYADLTEADIAATMGISKGAVKSHTARAMATLAAILDSQT